MLKPGLLTVFLCLFAFHTSAQDLKQIPTAALAVPAQASPAASELPVLAPPLTALPEIVPAQGSETEAPVSADIAPAVTPASKLPPVFEGKDDLATLNAAMAAAQFEVRPNLQNRIDLVSALSRLVSVRCMPGLHRTLIYRGSPENKDCVEAISYTLSVDPSNPEAICAKDGIDSISCRDAFREQRTLSTIPFAIDWQIWSKLSSEIRIKDSENSQALQPLFNELDAALNAFRAEKNEKNQASLASLYTRILDLQCSYARIIPNPAYEKDQSAQDKAFRETNQQGAGLDSEKKKDLPTFSQMLSQLSKSPAASTPIPGVFSRARLISERCQSTITRALELMPEFPRAVCHRDGFYSPSCIVALRRQKLAESTAAAKTPGNPPASGLPAKGDLQPF